MAERYFALSDADRREALAVSADKLGRPAHLLEKDVWVVWALQTLFENPIGTHLAFKGGTSLSKAYGVINRFSEDVDLTYDIRKIAPDLIADQASPLPASKSQANKWSKAIRERMPDWLETTVKPLLEAQLIANSLEATVRREADTLLVDYPALEAGTGYVRPSVLLEFGARSTGEPIEMREVVCDAAIALPDLAFPMARPRVMRAERTFWEKATAIHVYCLSGRFRGGDRFARHWSDLAALDNPGIVATAIYDQALARTVADHKGVFFIEKDAQGVVIDYHAAINGHLTLVPEGNALEALAEDFRLMVDDGLLSDGAPEFDDLIAQCRDIQHRANAASAKLKN